MSRKQKILQIVVALIIPVFYVIAYFPWSLLVLLAMALLVVMAVLIARLKRLVALRRDGFYIRGGKAIEHRVIYEERHGKEIRCIPLETANFEPGRDHVVVPTRESWSSQAPEWAKTRRDEIFDRVIKKRPKGWVELPSDWPDKQ